MDTRRRAALAWLALLAPIGAARSDPKVEAIFAKARQVVTSARTLQAEGIWNFTMGGKTEGTLLVRLMKPNLGWITMNGSDGKPESLWICEGNEFVKVTMARKEFLRTSEAASYGGEWGGLLVSFPPLRTFYHPAFLTAGPEHRYAGTKETNGKTYQVVEIAGKTPPEGHTPFFEGRTRYFFGPDGLLEGTESEVKQGDRSGTRSFWLTKVKLNVPMTAAQFAYMPPADFKDDTGGPEAEQARMAADLLKEGAVAPEFRLPTPEGSELSLTAARKRKKAVLINFWFCRCSPCREEMPHLQKVYDDLKEKELEIVAVNANDSAADITQYVNDNKLTFKIVMGGSGEQYTLGKTYGVLGYPTSYLVDAATGKIVWRGLIFTEEALREALANMGLK
jgi:thiol-disulfide isomerase/thioredoxin